VRGHSQSGGYAPAGEAEKPFASSSRMADDAGILALQGRLPPAPRAAGGDDAAWRLPRAEGSCWAAASQGRCPRKALG